MEKEKTFPYLDQKQVYVIFDYSQYCISISISNHEKIFWKKDNYRWILW